MSNIMDMEELILSNVVSRSLRKKLLAKRVQAEIGTKLTLSRSVSQYTSIVAILFPFCYDLGDSNVNAFHVLFVFTSNC